MENLEKELLTGQLQYFQVQRHDFLNNLQVIRGYLQLNMPERALGYIDETIAGLGPQQEISRVRQETLQALLLQWYFGFRMKGVETELLTPPAFQEKEYWRSFWSPDQERLFYAYTWECLAAVPAEEDPERYGAEIRFTAAPDGFTCSCMLYRDEEEYFQQVFHSGNGTE